MPLILLLLIFISKVTFILAIFNLKVWNDTINNVRFGLQLNRYNEFYKKFLEEMELVFGKDPTAIHDQTASSRKFPYHVSIIWKNGLKYHCAGVLINPHIVLTVAHCIIMNNNVEIIPEHIAVVGGKHEINDNGIVRDVVRITAHEEYDMNTKRNDIALIQLKDPYELSDEINIISFIEYRIPPKSKCLVTGFSIHENNNNDPINASKISTFEVLIQSKLRCKYLFWKRFTIYDGIICAGYTIGQRDTCLFSSGSPLVCKDQLVGVVSINSNCDQFYNIVIYTDVTYFHAWINKQIDEIINNLQEIEHFKTTDVFNVTERIQTDSILQQNIGTHRNFRPSTSNLHGFEPNFSLFPIDEILPNKNITNIQEIIDYRTQTNEITTSTQSIPHSLSTFGFEENSYNNTRITNFDESTSENIVTISSDTIYNTIETSSVTVIRNEDLYHLDIPTSSPDIINIKSSTENSAFFTFGFEVNSYNNTQITSFDEYTSENIVTISSDTIYNTIKTSSVSVIRNEDMYHLDIPTSSPDITNIESSTENSAYLTDNSQVEILKFTNLEINKEFTETTPIFESRNLTELIVENMKDTEIVQENQNRSTLLVDNSTTETIFATVTETMELITFEFKNLTEIIVQDTIDTIEDITTKNIQTDYSYDKSIAEEFFTQNFDEIDNNNIFELKLTSLPKSKTIITTQANYIQNKNIDQKEENTIIITPSIKEINNNDISDLKSSMVTKKPTNSIQIHKNSSLRSIEINYVLNVLLYVLLYLIRN